MMRVQVTLKSGAQIEFTADELTKKRNPMTGQLTGLEWGNSEPNQPALFTIIVDEIAAIVTTDIPSDWVGLPTDEGDPS